MKEYPLFAKKIQLHLRCPHCDKEFSFELWHLPSPNWEGDTVESSQNEDDDSCECPNCNASFDIDLFANIYYAELCVKDGKSGLELDDFNIIAIENEEYNNTLVMENFENCFEERVKTQYGDVKGIAYLDGHDGPGDVRKLFTSRKELNGKIILGFEITFPTEAIDEKPYCTVYAVRPEVLSSKGLDNLDFYYDVEEISLDNFSIDELNIGVKRLSFGFMFPRHLIKA